ncbi:MAG: ribosome-recycling factor [Candidatus Pacebacteria bacterium]|jgi:ribosome recycling factor|nr:ribosome-recycling factor [Candidatus Paceibacterota bacterium]MDD4994610.1 ribosome-recycling factor [Candidatus Paceibacterota bacterium]MDD5535270.1 ribosome-recycling factor [Candidatus Paceibacterota bacterium]
MLIKKFEEQTKKLLDEFYEEVLLFRTSRPTTALVENIKIDSYGTLTPLKHVAGISIKLPNIIIIELWDENLLPAVKKALESSSLGLNPSQEGKQIKLFLPALGKERKEELIKLIGLKKEDYRVKLRELRGESIEEINNKYENKELSEDEKFRLKEEIQKVVEKTNEAFDQKEEQKKQEILNS